MSEPGSGEFSVELEEPLSREDILIAQSEIKALLSGYFRYTPLEDVFTEPVPLVPVQNVEYRSLKKDFIGTRVVSGDLKQGAQERELQVIEKARKIRKIQVDKGVEIGQMIRLVEPGIKSDRPPIVEFLAIEAKGLGGGFRPPNAPNTRSTVDSALNLARSIVTPK